jgi:uncharacterized protein involved in exopolysaccharide biosynthesis
MIRQLVLLLLVFALMAALVIAAIWTLVIPEYRASAEVRVRPFIPHLVFQTEDNGMIPMYESFRNTQVSIMKSLTVLQRVLEPQAVKDTQWYKDPPLSLIKRLQKKTPAKPVERLRNALSIQPRPESEIIDVVFTDSSPEDAKIIVDAVLNQYMRYIGEKSDADEDLLYKKLVDQYKSLENELRGREAIIAHLRNSLGTGTPQELISKMRLRMEDTQARLSKVQTDIKVSEWELAQADTDDKNNIPDVSTLVIEKKPKYHEDSEWRTLDRNFRTLQHSIATSELEPNNPEIIRATKDMEFAEELLKLREAQLDEQWRDRQEKSLSEQKNNTSKVPIIVINTGASGYEKGSTSLEFQLARLKEEDKLLIAQLEKQKEDFKVSFANAQALDKEKNELQHKRELFEAVRRRLDQKNMESNNPAPIEVLSPAFAPFEPHKDHRLLYTIIVLVLNSLGIILSAWLLHRQGFL